jgi:16S rRNA G966 N2-methylase RsmD
MKNEKITENIVREKLRERGYSEEYGLSVEEQISGNPRIKKLLSSASKSGNGLGRPEFLVVSKKDQEFLLVFECKANPKFHESPHRDFYRDYAVDGVLLYAANLSREFHVIAVAVSGQSETELKISTFLQPKGEKQATLLTDKSGMPIREMLSWERYMAYAKFDKTLARIRKSDLMKFSRELHNYMRDYCKIVEAQKPLLVSGVLLALSDSAFSASYRNYDQEKVLARELFGAIRRVIGEAELGVNQENKKQAIGNAYQFITDHPELSKRNAKANETPLFHVVDSLSTNVKPFIEDHFDFDVIGNFYGEFIRYTGGDKKGLGIVLTPKHITELFADIAKLDKNATVLDTCAGTGGFLISAMKKMLDQAETEAEKERIKKQALIGVEQEPQMFALAVSNMILRGDGKTNLYQGSCFEEEIFDRIKDKADAGFINPPYSQKGEDLHEWNFVIRLLDALKKNATGIVIVPMSLAIAAHPLRERLLREHRLEAVMSMPDDLFYPVGVVACIMVFTAHVPHASDAHHESWFGYWKDDGFKKDRVEGRIPTGQWNAIREKWLHMYRRQELPGKSVWKKVCASDEWCAEAYLETDYESLSEKEFGVVLRKFVAFKALNQ